MTVGARLRLGAVRSWHGAALGQTAVWQKMLMRWQGCSTDIPAAAGVSQHALHSCPFIRETPGCWRCVLYVSRVPVTCLPAQLARRALHASGGIALPCTCRSVTGQQEGVSGCACELFWQAPACLLAWFWAGGRTRDGLQPGSIKLQNVQTAADFVCNARERCRDTQGTAMGQNAVLQGT